MPTEVGGRDGPHEGQVGTSSSRAAKVSNENPSKKRRCVTTTRDSDGDEALPSATSTKQSDEQRARRSKSSRRKLGVILERANTSRARDFVVDFLSEEDLGKRCKLDRLEISDEPA